MPRVTTVSVLGYSPFQYRLYSSGKNGNTFGFTHVDANATPTMVSILDKPVTQRVAHAQSIVQFPPHVLQALVASELKHHPHPDNLHPTHSPAEEQLHTLKINELSSAKGPIFSTAIIAGTMAVKSTHQLIPFCHPLPIESCKIKIQISSNTEVTVDCVVCVTHKTGVEMEALVGASVASLTIYDMCKALSHEIVIKETKLMAKAGGKSDYQVK